MATIIITTGRNETQTVDSRWVYAERDRLETVFRDAVATYWLYSRRHCMSAPQWVRNAMLEAMRQYHNFCDWCDSLTV